MNEGVLAVDLGGTNLRMAAVADDGAILHLTRRFTPKSVTPVELISLAGEMADECIEQIGADTRLLGIAFAAPAPAAKDSDGILTRLPNIPTLNGMNLKAALRDRFSFPVTVENDARAAAIGEHWLGASKDTDTSVIVTLGTGVGGGIIIDGEPYRGVDGTAGEIGHFCVLPDGHPCGCGSRGCVEQYASATAIVRMARENGLDVSTSLDVYRAFENGDERAAIVFRQMGTYLGIVLAGLVNTLNPDMIVIAGGASAAWDAFIKPLKDEIHLRAFHAPSTRVKIARTQLGDNAGILGAARSAFLHTEYPAVSDHSG
ncbi:MAG: ROK family protein [Pyrinomonadaceae bacterium]